MEVNGAAERVLGAIGALAKSDGVRISDIRGALNNALDVATIQAALATLALAGRVKRNDLNGTWRLPDAPVTPPPRPGVGSSRPPDARPPRVTPAPPTMPLPHVDDLGVPVEIDADGVVDHSQRLVIRADAKARQVVVAGPGFGKTAVACGRVAWLLRDGVEPAKILLLSFTRTAVREMRARIALLAGEVEGASAVDIRTLDSLAWRLRTGLSENPKAGQSYALNIDETLSMLQTPSLDVRDYLDGFDHVLVDEAQDLVGARAGLVVTMLQSLRDGAGWTVFLDPAQAIYDWADESDAAKGPQPSFEELLAKMTPPPTLRVLNHLHRTRDLGLRALLLSARKLVLDAPDDACVRLRAALEGRASAEPCFATTIAEVVTARPEGRDDLLLLARRRGEALELSSRLTDSGVGHRLRFGALPQTAAPWIAAVLNSACLSTTRTRVERDDVEAAWEAVTRTNAWLTDGWDFDRAWRLLRRLGRGSAKHSIEITRVSARLAGSSMPDDVVQREVGGRGPIVSTVHGSKGREANEAMLLLTSQHEHNIDEARVLYVGLSRAKERLDVRHFSASRWSHLEGSGRPWRRTKAGNLQIEVGRAGDLDLCRAVRLTASELVEQQRVLASFTGESRNVRVWSFAEREWARCIVPDDSTLPLATLSKDCVDDLGSAARQISKSAKTPTSVTRLRWFDLGSVGLPPDFVLNAALPEPWQSTRLFLSPVIVGPGVVGGIK